MPHAQGGKKKKEGAILGRNFSDRSKGNTKASRPRARMGVQEMAGGQSGPNKGRGDESGRK